MSVETEILRIQNNIAEAYGAVADKGGEVPLHPKAAKLAEAISSIPSGGPGGVPVGSVMIWPGTVDTIPSNWALCDGQDGRPDYRDIFLLGAGPNHAAGSAGGEEKHTLTTAEMPKHAHVESYGESSGTTNNVYPIADGSNPGSYFKFFGEKNGLSYDRGGKHTVSENVSIVSGGTIKTSATGLYDLKTYNAGGGTAHNNMPPYKAVLFIIKIAPDPAMDGVTMDMVYAAIAEALAGAGGGVPSRVVMDWYGRIDQVPDGWALCDGTNGTPDLRGKFTLGAGLSYEVGATGGEEKHTLTTAEMPAHSHTANGFKSTFESSGIKSATFFGTLTSGGTVVSQTVGSSGGSQPHNNMPPYYVLAKIMKL